MGYKTAGGSTDYSYDNNGNLTADVNKQITSINYNYLNLPSLVTGAKGNITYYYDAVGTKLEKIVYDNATNSTTSTYYTGGMVYQSTSSAPTIALQFIAEEEGRIRQTSNGSTTYFAYDYFLKDHLGNVRMTITDDYAMSDPIVDVTHYYPFGLAMCNYFSTLFLFFNSLRLYLYSAIISSYLESFPKPLEILNIKILSATHIYEYRSFSKLS